MCKKEIRKNDGEILLSLRLPAVGLGGFCPHFTLCYFLKNKKHVFLSLLRKKPVRRKLLSTKGTSYRCVEYPWMGEGPKSFQGVGVPLSAQ